MKTIPFIFVTIATIAMGCLHAQEIQNASFEDAGPESREAGAWGTWGSGWERVHLSEWAPVLDGEWMLAYKHWEQKSNADSGIFQDASGIEQGKSYRFRVRMFSDVPEWGSLPKTVELRIESVIDGTPATVVSERFNPTAMPTEEWVDLEVSGVAPLDNLRALIVVTPSDQPGGAIKFDLAELEAAH
jgi:hypothetical protein